MPESHGKQKRLQKQKKRRDALRKQQSARKDSLILPRSKHGLLERAAKLPHGPAFISADYRVTDAPIPPIVTVFVTRRAPGGLLVPATAMIDRTCLGVKDAFLGRAMTEPELEDYIAFVGKKLPEPLEPCDLLVAQSVVFHALDYARSLGFAPHRDFPAVMFGPRPERLLDTPFARPEHPIYLSGPHDDVPRILEKLRATGTNFSFVAGGPAGGIGGPLFAGKMGELAPGDEDEADEDEADEDEADEDGEAKDEG
jgi:hypothetical protein